MGYIANMKRGRAFMKIKERSKSSLRNPHLISLVTPYKLKGVVNKGYFWFK